MGEARWVRPNEAEAVAKVMDGEAILINLATGNYFSMDGVGAWIWAMIEAGDSIEAIVAQVASTCDILPQRASEDVTRLIAELVEQRLAVESDEAPVSGASQQPHATEKREYVPPTLNVYTDMGDLLALDPPVPGFEDISWEKRRA